MLVHNAEVTGSLKINNVLFNSGSFSGSFRGDGSQLTGIAGASTASYVEYSNVGNKPALVSGSSQITYSGLSGIPSGIVSGSSQVSFNGIVDKPTLVSGSSQVTYSGLTGIPSGIVSGSSQITYSGLSGVPSGIVSGSSQVTYSGLSGIPAGIVSGSAQVTGFGIFATTGSNQFNGNQAITGSLTVTGQVIAQTLNVQQVTSSIVFSSGSNIFGNTQSNTQQFTGSVSVTGSLTVTTTGTEFQVASTGVNLGNALTDNHIISGSVRINPNGLFVSGSGAVGIGTTNPSTLLHVSGSSSSIGRIVSTFALSSGFSDVVQILNPNQTGGGLSFNIGKAESTKNLGKIAYIHSSNGSDSNRLAFGFYDADNLLNLTAGGSVGIGTTDPQSKFDVTNIIGTAYDASNTLVSGQTMRIANTSTTSGISANLLFIATGASGGNGLGSISGVNTGTGSLALTFGTRDSGGSVTERMRITSGGNVGIGTNSVNAKLEVAVGTDKFRLSRTSAGEVDFSIDSSGNAIYDTTIGAGQIFRTNGGSERLRITSGGNVGIGETNPSRKLQVNGTGLFSGTLSTAKVEVGAVNSVNITTNSTFTLIPSGNFNIRTNILVSVTIRWDSNANAQRQYLLFIGATDTAWGTPNSAISVIASNDWSSGYVGAASFSIGGSSTSRTLNISVSNAATYNVTAYAAIVDM